MSVDVADGLVEIVWLGVMVCVLDMVGVGVAVAVSVVDIVGVGVPVGVVDIFGVGVAAADCLGSPSGKQFLY